MNELPPGPLYFTGDKAEVAHRIRPALAIEDSPAEAQWMCPDCPGLLIGQPYNRDYTWPQILTLL